MNEQSFGTHYFIKLWLDSVEEPIVLPVSAEDSERFSRNYEGDRNGFFVCATQSSTRVAVHLKCVQLAHLLWETGLRDEPKVEADSNGITLFFRNRNPVHSTIDEPVEIADILLALESGLLDEVLSFSDIDGEIMMFDPSALLFLEVPNGVVEEGEREMMEELESPAQE